MRGVLDQGEYAWVLLKTGSLGSVELGREGIDSDGVLLGRGDVDGCRDVRLQLVQMVAVAPGLRGARLEALPVVRCGRRQVVDTVGIGRGRGIGENDHVTAIPVERAGGEETVLQDVAEDAVGLGSIAPTGVCEIRRGGLVSRSGQGIPARRERRDRHESRDGRHRGEPGHVAPRARCARHVPSSVRSR